MALLWVICTQEGPNAHSAVVEGVESAKLAAPTAGPTANVPAVYNAKVFVVEASSEAIAKRFAYSKFTGLMTGANFMASNASVNAF